MSNENQDWAWYWSTDEECYRGGPFATKEECIEDANDSCDTCDYESFYIIEATKGTFDLEIEEYQLFDILDGNNEERVDPDGDGFAELFTKEQRADLVSSVNKAIEAWAEKQKMPHVWSFNETRNNEQIATKREVGETDD